MINGDLNYFIEKLNYGEDLYFIFQGRQYFVHGWVGELGNGPVAELHAYLVNENGADKEIWKATQDSLPKCAELFLNAKLWDNNNFYYAEKDIEWID